MAPKNKILKAAAGPRKQKSKTCEADAAVSATIIKHYIDNLLTEDQVLDEDVEVADYSVRHVLRMCVHMVTF